MNVHDETKFQRRANMSRNFIDGKIKQTAEVIAAFILTLWNLKWPSSSSASLFSKALATSIG